MKKENLSFIVSGVLIDPDTKTGMCGDTNFKLLATFSYLDSEDNFCYGNGTYLVVRGTIGFNPNVNECFDCRYDKRLKTGSESEFLETFFRDRWHGKNGAWAIKSMTIEKAD